MLELKRNIYLKWKFVKLLVPKFRIFQIEDYGIFAIYNR